MTTVRQERHRTPSLSTVVGPMLDALPTWPLTAMFALYPLWWALGVVDVMWIVVAGVMVGLLVRQRSVVTVPRAFGLWLLFLVWMAFSVIQIDSGGRLLAFSYRALLYLAAGVFFVYVYNGRHRITERWLSGLMTAFWLITVVGGYLGIVSPTTVIRTPASMVMPAGLASNEMIDQMVVRRFSQYNPDLWIPVDPRPSAPFLYTNNWGNVFSLTLPFVIGYMIHVRHTRRFWLLAAALPFSLVPAVLTLNRGMFIGIAVGALYASVRFLRAGNVRSLVALVVAGLIGSLVILSPGVQGPLTQRLEATTSTEDRASLYLQAIEGVKESPFFGFGVPRASETNVDPVGTQGQFWLVMYSHGIGGVLLFMAWLVVALLVVARSRGPGMLVCSTVVAIAIVESTYYGLVPNGLPIIMLAAAMGMREPGLPGPAVRADRPRGIAGDVEHGAAPDQGPLPGWHRPERNHAARAERERSW